MLKGKYEKKLKIPFYWYFGLLPETIFKVVSGKGPKYHYERVFGVSFYIWLFNMLLLVVLFTIKFNRTFEI